jgi:HEPN domain-containing protein
MPLNSLQEVERHLADSRAVKAAHPEDPYLSTTERTATFDQDVDATHYVRFILSGEKHYAVARLLFQFGMSAYALFCSQQAVENYFKAYVKSTGQRPHTTHSLTKLLKQCRETGSPPPFVMSDYAETIAQRFDAFNEVARYPVHKAYPSDKTYVVMYPLDMHVLDYFVFRMRELLPTPDDWATLFRRRHAVLGDCERAHPEVFSLIWKDNINVQAP